MPNSSRSQRTGILLGSSDQKKAPTNVKLYQVRIAVNIGSAAGIAAFISLLFVSARWPWSLIDLAVESAIPGFVASISSLLAYLFSESIAKQKGVPLIACSALFCLSMTVGALVYTVFPDYYPAKYLFLANSGATCALLLAFWFPHICQRAGETRMLFTISRIAFSRIVIASLGVGLLPLYLPLIVSFLFILSLFCGIFLHGQQDVSDPYKIARADNTDNRTMINIRSTVMLGLTYFQFGICCGTVKTLPEALAVLSALLLGGVVLYLDQKNDHVISENSLRPYTLSFAVIGFLLLCSSITVARFVALFLLAGIFSIVFSIGLSALCEHHRICKLNPTRIIAKANTVDFGSLCIGVAAGVLIANLELFYNPTHLVSILLGSAFCLVASICGKDRYPDESMLVMGFDPKKLEKSSLQQKCRVLADKNKLSPRQLEVLELLAVGRNARYIAERLTISQSTAQTHIRGIYTKLDVHSHQEMMDKVINTRLFSEE